MSRAYYLMQTFKRQPTQSGIETEIDSGSFVENGL